MTSDAKIGLLLGLFFIFIIAFIINGLPNFRNEADNNELTTNMANFKNDSIGIADKTQRAQESLDRIASPTNVAPAVLEQNTENQPPVSMDRTVLPEEQSAIQAPAGITNDSNIRYQIPLPENTFETINTDQVIKAISKSNTPVAKETKTDKTNQPKTYVVQANDNLGEIARKVYGAEQGNKKDNVTRIFEANRNVLKSPDEVYIGQILVIPPLPRSTSQESLTGSKIAGAIFDTVKSVGRKNVSTDDSAAKTGRWYQVKQDDSLWKIAAEQLGSGARYKEISKLNADILKSEDDLTLGMRLRLPAK